MKREKLGAQEIADRLTELPGWGSADGKLTKRYEFADFAESMRLVNAAAEIAESADHHPDICFGWGYAQFDITTHDRGGITELDFHLAGEIEKAASSILDKA